jgi:hypothetical protein
MMYNIEHAVNQSIVYLLGEVLKANDGCVCLGRYKIITDSSSSYEIWNAKSVGSKWKLVFTTNSLVEALETLINVQ